MKLVPDSQLICSLCTGMHETARCARAEAVFVSTRFRPSPPPVGVHPLVLMIDREVLMWAEEASRSESAALPDQSITSVHAHGVECTP